MVRDNYNIATHPDDDAAPHTFGDGKPQDRGVNRITAAIKQSSRIDSPLVSLLIALGGILLADIIAMIVVYHFLYIPYHFLVIIDAITMALVIIPLLYLFSLRPLLAQIEMRRNSETILNARLRLVEYANSHTIDELMIFILDEAESLTNSQFGFLHFLDEDQQTIHLQAWSTRTRNEQYSLEKTQGHYDLAKAGVWADAVRQRLPVIHNDYQSQETGHGFPKGHVTIVREMVVPVLRNSHVVAIMGLGNKLKDYNQIDLDNLSIYAGFAWDVIEYLRAVMAVQESEQKFRTLADWMYDWELWLDIEGNMVYVSPSCERITGYTPAEFTANPELMTEIVHPEDRPVMEDHQSIIHDTSANPITIEYRLIARDASEHWIEHICRPLFSADGQHLGRRISNRDITERKHAETQIIEQNRKEQLLTLAIRTLQTDIARDLHDTLGNQIGFLRMNLEYLSDTGWNDPLRVQEQLQKMTTAANEAYEMIRAMLAVLQTDDPTDPLGLFTNYARRIADRASFTCEISSLGQPRQLTPYQIRQLFFIFREALGNIEKYSQAHHVYGELIWDEHDFRMTIKDDGIGFMPEGIKGYGHYGLQFMRERSDSMTGRFDIHSIPGQGTTITVYVPYEAMPELAQAEADL